METKVVAGAGTEGALKGLRSKNRRQVLELLLTEGPLRRAELARRMHTSRTTISNIINELLERGVVRSESSTDGLASHGHERIEITPSAGFSLGIDFTFANVAINISDLSSKTVAEMSFAVDPADSAETRVAAAAAAMRELLESTGIANHSIIGMGVGVPGQIDRRSYIVGVSLPGQAWSKVDVGSILAKYLPFPLFLENNSRLEAFAEKQWGAGQATENMVFLDFSSGVGLALFNDGRLFRGSIGAAGEVGHMSTDVNGPVCPCGNRGCLVLRTGIGHILSLLRPALGANASWEDVVAATAAGDPNCVAVISEIGTVVGRFLAGIANLLNPELIVIGGDLAQTGDQFVSPIAAAVNQHSLPMSGSNLKVVQAQLLPGAGTGARGGSALALRELSRTAAIDKLGVMLTKTL